MTGVEAAAPAPRAPSLWNLHPQFHPFLVRQRMDSIAHAVGKRLREDTYAPLPMLEKTIPKASGGVRVVTQLSLPDAAASRWLFDRLMEKHAWNFSAWAFAYRSDRGRHDAVFHLHRELRRHGEVYVVGCDFEDYFDSIEHEYVLRILRDEFRATRRDVDLVESFLRCRRARSIDDYGAGRFYLPDRGLPQGATVSLFLANTAAWALDRKLERHSVAFARFSDDITCLCATEQDAKACLSIIDAHGKYAGTEINWDKSPGVRLLCSDPLPGEKVISHIDFVGARISADGIGIAAKSVAKIKRTISRRLHARLLLHPRRGRCNPERVVGFDRELLAALRAVRRYIYGRRVSEDGVRNRERPERAPRRPLTHLAIVRGVGVHQLRQLDGWLLNVIERIYRERCRVLAGLGLMLPPITRAELLSGAWAPPDRRSEARAPSFVLAHRYLARLNRATVVSAEYM